MVPENHSCAHSATALALTARPVQSGEKQDRNANQCEAVRQWEGCKEDKARGKGAGGCGELGNPGGIPEEAALGPGERPQAADPSPALPSAAEFP